MHCGFFYKYCNPLFKMFELINIATLASKEKMGSYCWGFWCNTCMWGTKYPSKKKKKKKRWIQKENNEERIKNSEE